MLPMIFSFLLQSPSTHLIYLWELVPMKIRVTVYQVAGFFVQCVPIQFQISVEHCETLADRNELAYHLVNY